MQGTTFEWLELIILERKVLTVIRSITSHVVIYDARQHAMREELIVQVIDRR